MSTATATTVTVSFDPTAINKQSDIIGPATPTKAGAMTAAQAAELASIVAGTVSSVSGTAPIVSTGGLNPDVSITPATPLAAGSMSAADKAKLDSLSPSEVTQVTGTAPITSTGGATPNIAITPATALAPGSMSAADFTKLAGIPPGGGGPPFTDLVFAVVDAVDPTKIFKIDVQGNAATTQTIRTNQTANRTQDLQDFDGVIPVVQTATQQIFLNQTAADNGSNAGVQYRSDVSNRGSAKFSQYGANTGVPGVTTFKSRGTLGNLAVVAVADVIGRLTAIAVTDNLSIPLSGLASFNVTAVPAGQGWVGTEWEIQNVSNLGPANGRRVVHKIDSEGVPSLREDRYPASLGNSAMGVVATGAGGTVVVANTNIKANTRIMLTVQDGGAVPLSSPYVSARVVGTSFTIQMVNALDVGVNVLYQLTQVAP